jgi:fructose-1,6-bisphosphatase II
MDRNLALEFVRVTEAAALNSALWMGKGDKIKADGAAVEAMRKTLNDIAFHGVIVIGEGEKDEAPMLYSGEKVGRHINDNEHAVDPLECTSNLANGKPNSISVLAAGPRGSMLKAPGTYMDQIVVGKYAKGAIDINDSVKNNLIRIAEALKKDISEVTVCILDRPRLQNVIKQIRESGARIRLIEHGTVSGAISAGIDNSGIDVLMGDGGAPETVIVAAAMKCLGGEVQAKIKPHSEKTEKEAEMMGLRKNKVYHTDDLAKGDNLLFAATGISDGHFLKGVVFKQEGAVTHSIVMRSKSNTIRFLETHHNFSKIPKY